MQKDIREVEKSLFLTFRRANMLFPNKYVYIFKGYNSSIQAFDSFFSIFFDQLNVMFAIHNPTHLPHGTQPTHTHPCVCLSPYLIQHVSTTCHQRVKNASLRQPITSLLAPWKENIRCSRGSLRNTSHYRINYRYVTPLHGNSGDTVGERETQQQPRGSRKQAILGECL